MRLSRPGNGTRAEAWPSVLDPRDAEPPLDRTARPAAGAMVAFLFGKLCLGEYSNLAPSRTQRELVARVHQDPSFLVRDRKKRTLRTLAAISLGDGVSQ